MENNLGVFASVISIRFDNHILLIIGEESLKDGGYQQDQVHTL